ncbi:MAG: FliH/SctL family protein [Candidatus Baltobacteraceae bacterium]
MKPRTQHAQPHSFEYSDAPPAPYAAEALPQIDAEAARAEAAQLVDDASADAARLLEDARERALQLVDDGLARVAEIESSARQSGFDQGMGDGRAAAGAEMDEMLETMRGLVEMARVERYKIIEGAEPEIVRLALHVCERILNAHILVQPETVLEMARSAISRLVTRETVTVRVHPADIALMRDHRDRLMSMNDIDNLRLVEDQRVDRGGVVIDTESGTIDAKISTQLRQVRRLLAVEEPLSVAPSSEPPIINAPAQAS